MKHTRLLMDLMIMVFSLIIFSCQPKTKLPDRQILTQDSVMIKQSEFIQNLDSIEVSLKEFPFSFRLEQVDCNTLYAVSNSFPLKIIKTELPILNWKDIIIINSEIYYKKLDLLAGGSYFKNGRHIWQVYGTLGVVRTNHPYNLPDTLFFLLQYDNILWFKTYYHPNGNIIDELNDTLYVYDLDQNKVIKKFNGYIENQLEDTSTVVIRDEKKNSYLSVNKRSFTKVKDYKEKVTCDNKNPILHFNNHSYYVKNVTSITNVQKIGKQIIGIAKVHETEVLFWYNME